jgi:hypothetical protein
MTPTDMLHPYGFLHWNTGGNCTALVRSTPSNDGTVREYVVVEDAGQAPTTAEEPILWAVNLESEGQYGWSEEQIVAFRFPSTHALVAFLRTRLG